MLPVDYGDLPWCFLCILHVYYNAGLPVDYGDLPWCLFCILYVYKIIIMLGRLLITVTRRDVVCVFYVYKIIIMLGCLLITVTCPMLSVYSLCI